MKDPKGPVKSYKTVEELSKKHDVSINFIKKQVEMGTKVELEHTSDKSSAKIIALQHIDEMPDYYTRLKKVEKSSKINEDHKEIESGKKKDEEGYMARIELDKMERSINILRKVIKKSDTQIPAWVQSKITRSADFIDTAAEYLMSDQEVMESKSPSNRGLWANIHAKRRRGEKPARPGEKGYPKTLDIEEGINQARKNVGASKCWKGKKLGNPPTKMKGGKKVPNCVPESVAINDANGNQYVEFIDIIKPKPLKPSKGIGSKLVGESISNEPKLKPGSGLGGGKPSYQKGKEPKPTGAKLPILQKAGYEPQGEQIDEKCWKGYKQVGMKKKGKKIVPNCVPEQKTFNQFMEAVNKSKMKCNSPKSEPVGDSLTGKSHVVKACEGGKEKIIRFGQRGVKGSPKKKGESKEYASRRHRFQTRHAKNIAKGKMSAAYWANKVKW